MALEIAGELLVNLIQVVCESKYMYKKIIAFTILLTIIIGGLYYASTINNENKQVKNYGKIIYKLDNDSILVDIGDKKKVIRIPHYLYINKKENDTIYLK